MRILVWNVRRATLRREKVWDYFREIDPDVAMLQEVGSLPQSLLRNYDPVKRNAYAGDGNQQKFSTCLLVKGSVVSQLLFSTPWDWVNEELENFTENLVGAEISVQNDTTFRAISVYGPTWPIFDRKRLNEIDATAIKLKNNPDVWLTEILWAALLHQDMNDTPWLIAGDLNSSITFDTLWSGGPRGNQEIQDRMSALGLTECLAHHQGRLTPTFRNASNKQIVHQMDHLFVSNMMIDKLQSFHTGSVERVFGQSLSDHLPIIAEFDD